MQYIFLSAIIFLFSLPSYSLEPLEYSEFSATNPQDSSLLTISIPIGLQFRNNSGEIVVKGQGSNLKFDSVTGEINDDVRNLGLKIADDKTLALVGSEILIEGGNLTADPGKIELWSVIEGDLGLISENNLINLEKRQLNLNLELRTQNSELIFLRPLP